jgi:hypothetical protein
MGYAAPPVFQPVYYPAPPRPRWGSRIGVAAAFVAVLGTCSVINSGLREGRETAAPSAAERAAVAAPSPTDSLGAATAVCYSLVKSKVPAATDRSISGVQLKRDPGTGSFVGTGRVRGRQFLCAIDPDGSGKGSAVLRDQAPDFYDEFVRLFKLSS